MGSLTNFAENELVDHVFGTSYTPIATLYLALFTGDPTDTGSDTDEATFGQYARTAITVGVAASRRVTQDAIVTYNQCDSGSEVITHWGIVDNASFQTGNMLAYGALTSNKTVSSGKTPSVASGEVWVEYTAGIISDYLSLELLDHMFNNAVYTQPAIWLALIETTEITDSDTGSTIDELDMTNYGRAQPGTGWTVSVSSVTNNGIVDFGTLEGTGETITSAALCDAETTGQVLFYDNAQNQTVDDGDDVQYADGAFDLEMT